MKFLGRLIFPSSKQRQKFFVLTATHHPWCVCRQFFPPSAVRNSGSSGGDDDTLFGRGQGGMGWKGEEESKKCG